ncbi:MAG TPA: hypothetical protein VHI55_00780 [Gaiellaceae bacterium]|nr:hypothetical protein [Gaiellaceae bacterium]
MSDELAADVEAEPGAADCSVPVRKAIELFEDPLLLRPGDAVALVSNGYS